MNANQIESVAQVNNTKKRRQNQIMGGEVNSKTVKTLYLPPIIQSC